MSSTCFNGASLGQILQGALQSFLLHALLLTHVELLHVRDAPEHGCLHMLFADDVTTSWLPPQFITHRLRQVRQDAIIATSLEELQIKAIEATLAIPSMHAPLLCCSTAAAPINYNT